MKAFEQKKILARSETLTDDHIHIQYNEITTFKANKKQCLI